MQNKNNKDLKTEETPVDQNIAMDGQDPNATPEPVAPGQTDPDKTSADPVQDEKIESSGETIKKSTKRMFGNGSLRVFLVIATVVFGGIALLVGAIWSKTGDDPVKTAGDVAVPNTTTKASAVVTPEQAAYIKAQQEKEGLAAEERGETYIAEFVTERPPEDDLLGEPVQPTSGMAPDIERKQFFDNKGNAYTAQQAARMAAQGQMIEGVTIGAGSIADPNLGAQNQNASNQTKGSAKTAASGTAAQPTSTYEPYVVTPYQPKTDADTAQSELVSTNSAALDQSVKDAEEWNRQYLSLRHSKASLYDAKAQMSFEKQVGNLEGALKPPIRNVYETRYNTVSYPSSAPANQEAGAVATPAADKAAAVAAEPKPTVYAGETFRAILKNEVNTDNGNEVIATLLQGPYKGATLIGSVNKTNNNIQFNFTRLLQKGKLDIPVTATARQIGTNSSGMADTINKHYIKRYSALVISSALSGVGEAYEQTAGSSATIEGATVVATSSEPSSDRIVGNAVGELGDELSDEIKRQQNTPTTYITKTGKVFNIFFSESVVEQPKNNKK